MSKLEQNARYIKDKYPNSPLHGNVLRLVSMMKVHEKEVVTAEECRAVLERE
jgi:hypothetical protein